MSTDSAPERYRRRSRWPALVIIAFLAVATTITWIAVLEPEPVVSNACNEPGPAPNLTNASTTAGSGSTDPSIAADTASADSAASDAPAADSVESDPAATDSGSAGPATRTTIITSLGAITDKNTMVSTRPASPTTVRLRVLNASTVNGLAKTVTEQFREQGFETVRPAAGDPLYPAADLRCYAEIRYGDAGIYAARTVLIGAPCATLVKDNRIDDSVDLALGALYEQAEFTEEAKAQLQQAINESKPPNVIEGQTAAPVELAKPPPLPTAVCPS